jgi:hypothetical protein
MLCSSTKFFTYAHTFWVSAAWEAAPRAGEAKGERAAVSLPVERTVRGAI